MKSVCKFCEKYGGSTNESQIADHIVFESENFVVVPSIGSIIPGWLLIVPRKHFLSVGSFHEEMFHEFLEIRTVAVEALTECFGSVFSFEHGAVRERESIGCGVDHAHMHLVAADLDLVASVKEMSKSLLEWRPVSGIASAGRYVVNQLPYVFIQPPSGEAWIGSAQIVESQLVRKAIATHAGQAGSWDWKKHPFQHNAKETVVKLEAWKAARAQSAILV